MAPVVWKAHHRTGRLAPIDAEPVEGGNILLLGEGAYQVLGRQPQASLLPLPPTFTSHFATCPQAATWRGANPSSG
jgi:hypothetical protein